MSNFPIQMQMYDDVATSESISQFQTEYNEEVQLKNKLLEQNSDTKIQEAIKFVTDYGDIIDQQHTTLHDLDQQLRSIVAENKTLQEQDAAFDQLINDERYIELAGKMGSLKQTIVSLDSFLVEQGVKGLPSPQTN